MIVEVIVINYLTGYQLNQFLLNMYRQNHFLNSIRNFQKVIKASLSVACYHYGYIKYDPSAGIWLPRMTQEELINCNIFLEDNKDSELLNIINEIANLKHDLFDVKIIHTEKK